MKKRLLSRSNNRVIVIIFCQMIFSLVAFGNSRVDKVNWNMQKFTFRCSNRKVINNRSVQGLVVNVRTLGAKGDGMSDDWFPIQRAIDSVAAAGGGKIYLPNGNYLIKDKTIIVWGNNVILEGQSISGTILVKTGNAGWWGDAIAIAGKSKGGKYYGGFGKLDYKSFLIYTGENVPATNIEVRNLTLKTRSSNISNLANNLGVVNSDNVLVENCLIADAPQTNVAVVNDTKLSKNVNIKFEKCTFSNPGDHNFRAISYNKGAFIGNSVSVDNCTFSDVESDSKLGEIKDKHVHLWYRAGCGGRNINLNITNSTFDKSANIVGTINISNFSLLGSSVDSQLILEGTQAYNEGSVKINNNRFNLNQKGRSAVNIVGITNIQKNANTFIPTVSQSSRFNIKQ